MEVLQRLVTEGWSVVHTIERPPRGGETFAVDDLPLMAASRQFIDTRYSGKIYRHQKEAVRLNLGGEHVCLTTGTASGKSLPFLLSGVDLLARDSSAKLIAIYPMKALGYEQEERWREALSLAGCLHRWAA